MSLHRSANYYIAEQISAALDPTTAHGEVRTLAGMSADERKALHEKYDKPPTK